MKKLQKKLLILSLFITGNLAVSSVAQADFMPDKVCDYVNYQYKSVESQQKEEPINLGGYMFVITEERLGTADKKNSFDCYRVIECTVKPTPQAKETDPKTYIRSCKATYTTSNPGNCSSSADINKYMGEPATLTSPPYTICEPIRVYVSGAGTELLYYYIGQVYKYIAMLGGLIAVLALILAGIMRATAGDNTNQIANANKIVTKCITGLIVLFTSAIILYTINPNFFIIS